MSRRPISVAFGKCSYVQDSNQKVDMALADEGAAVEGDVRKQTQCRVLYFAEKPEA